MDNCCTVMGEQWRSRKYTNQHFLLQWQWEEKLDKLGEILTITIQKGVSDICNYGSCRELDHSNLCKFIGASVEAPEIAILTEYCPKGSLNDVLQNDEIPLNWGFRFSFARDISRAMAYLHQRRIYHGHLKSSNCIIDDRWVLKITGKILTFLMHWYILC